MEVTCMYCYCPFPSCKSGKLLLIPSASPETLPNITRQMQMGPVSIACPLCRTPIKNQSHDRVFTFLPLTRVLKSGTMHLHPCITGNPGKYMWNKWLDMLIKKLIFLISIEVQIFPWQLCEKVFPCVMTTFILHFSPLP